MGSASRWRGWLRRAGGRLRRSPRGSSRPTGPCGARLASREPLDAQLAAAECPGLVSGPLTLSDPVFLWSRLESRAPAFDACRLGPARGGLGDAPAAARRSRCRLRSARARINFTHVVELVPYSCASARRGGVDGGGVRRRPERSARNANEAVRKSCDTDPRAPVRHIQADARSGRLARSVVAPAWCANPAAGGGPASPPASPRASGAGCGPNRDGMALWRDHRNGVPRGDCAQQRRMDRDDDGRACAGKVDDRHRRQRRVRSARVLRTDRGGPRAAW